MRSDQELIRYYSQRAAEYDRIYQKPERQADLATLREVIAGWCANQKVLEVACGTGYWTEAVAGVASSIVATDASEEVLAIAKNRNLPEGRVTMQLADAFHLEAIEGDFTALLAGFWVSHLERDHVSGFLDGVNERIGNGGTVVLLDNRYVEGSSTPIARRDAEGNTFQERGLDRGETCEVLKNFFEIDELSTMIAAYSDEIEIRELRHYWAARYRIEI